MLTCDAFGVLPPIARLTPAQAMYHFLSGYTAQVAGTEKGLGAEPQATFSTCFGAPFLPRRPEVYGRMLAELIAAARRRLLAGQHRLERRPVRRRPAHEHPPHPRPAARRAGRQPGRGRSFRKEPFFGLAIPEHVPGVPAEVLDPRQSWADKAAYDRMARELVGRFEKNFRASKRRWATRCARRRSARRRRRERARCHPSRPPRCFDLLPAT